MIRAVSFDLDGTLIDSTEAIVASFFHTFEVVGEPPPPRQAIVDSIGYVLEDQFAVLTKQDPAQCVRIYREHYGKVASEMTFLLPGARAALERLSEAGLALGYATSKCKRFAAPLLEHLGVAGFFQSGLGPEEVTHPKPHPEAVLRSAEGLGVSPEELFFVGDTHFDVLAAREAQVRCLCVTTGYATRQALEALGPEAVFDDLASVVEHVLSNRG